MLGLANLYPKKAAPQEQPLNDQAGFRIHLNAQNT